MLALATSLVLQYTLALLPRAAWLTTNPCNNPQVEPDIKQDMHKTMHLTRPKIEQDVQTWAPPPLKPLALEDATPLELIERLATLQNREPKVLQALLASKPSVATRRRTPSKRSAEGDADGSANKQQRT